ncbi:hypothetical protein [Aquibacillus saliphilus]|uniref:hypothetical protein n=1 Tax=Aquibacillus saliphilus TaxID=1909422 RepID=UPI001CEFDCDA|nr:hypothetical protein [Aquibacillus saliphilus]
MDTVIIEHLACLEINENILQPPFRLLSNVQMNDKGLAFDGSITLFLSEIKKDKFAKNIPIQIKGTATNKKSAKRNKIKHSVSKSDIEVYYKDGNGVLYFVVTINPITYSRQAYYRILAPLDLKDLLIDLKYTGNKSITIPFRKLEKGLLEDICKQFLRIVEKQPKNFIEANSEREFTEYKLDYYKLKEESSFDLFEESAYMYGIESGNEIPISKAKLHEIRTGLNDEVKIGNDVFRINYEIRETVDKRYLLIEESLVLEINKSTNKGKITLGKVKSLRSHIKALKIIKYLRDHNKIPIEKIGVFGSLDVKEDFSEVEQDIKQCEEIVSICDQIGISDDYKFDDNENISELFNGILKLFKEKQYQLLTNYDSKDFDNSLIQVIRLSEYVKVMVLFDKAKNEFIDFFSEKTLNTIAGLIPKEENQQNVNAGVEQNYWKVSIYSSQKIKVMEESANFKFDIVKKSFTEKYYEVNSPYTISIALDYINYYDMENESKYIEFAEDLIHRYLEINPHETIALINKYQINVRKLNQLTEKEEDHVLDILEEAERKNNKNISFACEVLLGNRSKAKRIFYSIPVEEQDNLKRFPIYHLFDK